MLTNQQLQRPFTRTIIPHLKYNESLSPMMTKFLIPKMKISIAILKWSRLLVEKSRVIKIKLMRCSKNKTNIQDRRVLYISIM